MCYAATITPASVIAAKRHLRREASMATRRATAAASNVETRNFHALYVDHDADSELDSQHRHWAVGSQSRSGTGTVRTPAGRACSLRARLQPEQRGRLSEWQARAGAEPPPTVCQGLLKAPKPAQGPGRRPAGRISRARRGVVGPASSTGQHPRRCQCPCKSGVEDLAILTFTS
jgi:hypothetical protein